MSEQFNVGDRVTVVEEYCQQDISSRPGDKIGKSGELVEIDYYDIDYPFLVKMDENSYSTWIHSVKAEGEAASEETILKSELYEYINRGGNVAGNLRSSIISHFNLTAPASKWKIDFVIEGLPGETLDAAIQRLEVHIPVGFDVRVIE